MTTPSSPAEVGGATAAVLAHGDEAGIALRHLVLRPRDADGPARARRLAELGIGGRRPVPAFDAVSRDFALRMEAPLAGVNLIDDRGQYFAGLHAPPSEEPPVPEDGAAPPPAESGAGREDGADSEERALPSEMAFCPHVVARRRALVLEDIHDFARFSVDPVVDLLNVRSYLGAPLMDPSGIALGTIWVVDHEPRRWGREGLAVVKELAAELTERIQSGEFRDDGPSGA
ncbi:GAF domain-containing protein [Streptomyces sp. 4N509B]|uniref:GAF domain-containing protein n=1 Tax=Streptomyces sp. 4N509B TaxID=3457413 RepID=UPI003FD09341